MTNLNLNLEGIEKGQSELLKTFLNSKPIFKTNSEAVTALTQKLKKIADEHQMSIESMIEEAHTTSNSKSHHIQILSIVRQINFLSK